MNDIYSFPDSSLNRLTISQFNPIGTYRDLSCRELLSARTLHKLQKSLGKAWIEEMAARIASLIFTLHEGDYWNDTQAESQLSHIRLFWHHCGSVMLGGGLLAGDNGPIIVDEAQMHLDQWDVPKELCLFRPAEHMPLFGAAVNQPEGSLILDFGHGSVKGMIKGSDHLFSYFPIKLSDLHNEMSLEYAKEVDQKIIYALKHFFQQLENKTIPKVVVTMAAYVHDNEITENPRGSYCKLRLINTDGREYFRNRWKSMTGEDVEVDLFHDGTAAARLLEEDGAAIVFGTSVGHGFKSTKHFIEDIL